MDNLKIVSKAAPSIEMLRNKQVHVIDLCASRASAGALWNSISAGLHMRMGSIMSLHLSSADCYEKLDDTRYLIITPGAFGDEGGIKAIRIASAFVKSLNGACNLSDIRIDLAIPQSRGEIGSVPLRIEQLAILAEKAELSDVALPPHLRGIAGKDSHGEEKQVSREIIQPDYEFSPIWDSYHEAITTYLCQPASMDDVACRKIEDLPLKDRTHIELMGLMTGAKFLSEDIERGDRFLLGVPVSFETMCSPFGRTEFVAACRGLPFNYRQYLSFILTDIPLGVTYSRLTDLAMSLRPFGRVTAGVASGCRNFHAYDGHGFSSIAFDLKNSTENGEMTRADIVHVASAGRKMKWGAMILNVNDAQTFNIVAAADCQQIQGTAIAPSRHIPRRMTHLPREAIHGGAAEAGCEEWF